MSGLMIWNHTEWRLEHVPSLGTAVQFEVVPSLYLTAVSGGCSLLTVCFFLFLTLTVTEVQLQVSCMKGVSRHCEKFVISSIYVVLAI